MLRAVQASDLPGVQAALASGADPNAMTMLSLLSEATRLGDVSVIQALLDAGADPDVPDQLGGVLPATWALLSRDEPALRLLLGRGASTDGPFGGSILHMVAGMATTAPEFMRVILECGPASLLESTDGAGLTPLVRAVEMGDLQRAAELLEAGARSNTQGPKGETPLGTAIRHGNLELCELLINAGADPSVEWQGEHMLAKAKPDFRASVEALVLARQVTNLGSGPRPRL